MINFIKSSKLDSDWPLTNSEVVFVGRSNVGKSSFINALYKANIAKVGKTAGKTRLINFFNVDDKYTAVDVPGYGFANRSEKEIIEFGQMMENYFSNRQNLNLVVMIVDIRHKPTKDDLLMIDFLKAYHKKIMVIANKSDKLSYSQSLKALKEISRSLNIPGTSIYKASALKKENIEDIRKTIDDILIQGA